MSETDNKSSTMAVAGCVAMIGIAWALATICVFINIRNGVRLTTDNYGSLLNGALVAGVSVALIAATSFTGDITYIPTWTGFLYLAVTLDAFSRRIVGWAMATTLHAQLVLDALNMALATRRPKDVIHHSDQGSQYTCIEFGKRCREAGVRPSMGSASVAWAALSRASSARPCQWAGSWVRRFME